MAGKISDGIVLGILFWLSLIDYRKKAIPVVIPVISMGISFLLQVIRGQDLTPAVLSAVVFLSFFLLVSRGTKRQIGSGDAFVFGMTGAELGGFYNIWLVFLAFVLALIGGFCMILIQKKGKNTVFPFIPYIFAAYLILMLERYVLV